MEKNLEHLMDELLTTPGVYGCVFGNQHGLCLGTKGPINSNSTGVICAIAKEASKLEPNSKPPVVQFENDTHSCTIQNLGNVTGAIFKSLQS
ncbi:unnamed protein product [Phyllotreta striolata]|uniref:Late endosomal/lysosomal adaptor and MAPK and MTOR activator 5 n=1 Tax=Phyllotreta striolata TaxID=444603 RepID=A0A9N9TT36_PHYSR|nr:unnamed protein product [Phyllotreta striolata]